MKIEYYKVLTVSTDLVDNSDWDCLGQYSTLEKAEECLKRWAELKGIPFESNYYVLTDDWMTSTGAYSVCGLYYNADDKQVSFNSDWVYCTSAHIQKCTLVLDEDD